MEDNDLGKRIRAWRRRRSGMSQATLAGLAGLSQGYISQLESGDKPLDRKHTQAAIAAALNVSVAQLIGQAGGQDDPVRACALAHVPTIRNALVEISSGERRTPRRDRDTLIEHTRQLTDARNAADYAQVAAHLPDLLLDLYGAGPALTPQLVEALFATRYALKTMGYPDLGLTAAQVGVRVADEFGDPAWLGQATYSLVQAYPVESAALGATRIAAAADALQDVSGRAAQEVYGCLHILAGFQHAVQGDAATAGVHLDEATAVAVRLGEPDRYADLSAGFNGNWFGPTQVDYWRVAVAAELGDAGEAIRVADRIDLQVLPVPNRWVYLWIDLARAQVANNMDAAAMVALGKAERAAPQHFRFNPVTANLVHTIIGRAKRRAVSADMLGLARKLGLDAL